LYLVTGVAIVLATILAAYVLTNENHGRVRASGIVLEPAGTGLSLPGGQYSSIAFSVSSPSVISGTLNSSEGVWIFVLTPSQLLTLARTNNVTGYQWASGMVAHESIYDLDIPIPSGAWDLVIDNPSLFLPTGVGIYTDIVLNPA
jgi:hypothetical protein